VPVGRCVQRTSACVAYIAAFCFALVGCGGSDLTAPTNVATISLSAPNTTLTAGAQVQLSAAAHDSAGRAVDGVKITYASSDTAVVQVSATGVAAGRAVGSATVRASAGRAADSLRLTVGPGAPARIAVAPATPGVAAGETLQLQASVTDAEGNPVPGASATWAISDSTVATVSSSGVLTGRRTGTTTVTVSAGGATTSLTVTVTPAPVASVAVSPAQPSLAVGDTLTLADTARDAAGDALPGISATWATSDASVATVSSTGLVTALSVGTATITATVEAKSATAALTVHPPPVATVGVTPSNTSLLGGATVQLAAVASDARGQPIAGASFTWTTSDAGVATVSSSGLVKGVNAGSATITATSGGKSGTAAIAVTDGAGARLNEVACSAGGSTQLMDVFIPSNSIVRPLPTAVYVHGGGWNSGDKTGSPWFPELRDSLLNRGFIVVSVDYRLAPTYKWPAQIQDVKCAIRSLRAHASRYGVDGNRIGIFGESAGGQLAALTDVTDASAGFDNAGGFTDQSSRVKAVASVSGIYDLTRPGELTFPGPEQVFTTWPDSTSSELINASPLHWVSGDDGAALLIHGQDDPKVNVAQAQRMALALQSKGVPFTLTIVANADHGLESVNGQPISPTHLELTRELVSFLDSRVR
jgi:acetyl esterase/lipase